MDLARSNVSVIELLPLASVTGDGNGSGVNVSSLEGPVRVIAQIKNTAGTTPTMALKLQHSEDDGSTDTYADVTGGAFTGATDAAYTPNVLTLNANDLKKYVRVVKDIGGTSSPAFLVGVIAIGETKY